jgi:hypothetical protein
LKNASQVSSCWPYSHDRFEDEIFTKNTQDWDKVMARMFEPKATRFMGMSLDEKETTVEHLAHGVLRAREERITSKTSEAAEAPLIAPTQGRVIHLVKDRWERGLLMLERA